MFAISFFGYFEIVLPSSFASKADARSGIGDMLGIFFMALTLVIVSFSCTGPILGTLLVSAFTSQNGAWQLTAGMAGFGIGLGFPFVIFALFPNWLQSLPKSGGWMNELKVVFGFIELAMAVKFLSQADLVKQWGFLKREIFIGIWIVGGVYALLGAISVAELGAMIPRSGGFYVFAHRAIGNYAGFVVGWLNWGFYDHPGAGDCSSLHHRIPLSTDAPCGRMDAAVERLHAGRRAHTQILRPTVATARVHTKYQGSGQVVF